MIETIRKCDYCKKLIDEKDAVGINIIVKRDNNTNPVNLVFFNFKKWKNQNGLQQNNLCTSIDFKTSKTDEGLIFCNIEHLLEYMKERFAERNVVGEKI